MATTTAGALAARDYRGNPNSQQGELRTYLTASIEWLRVFVHVDVSAHATRVQWVVDTSNGRPEVEGRNRR